MGKTLIIIGLLITGLGLLLYLKADLFNWFGNLPGDIKIKKENFNFYMPITSMIIVSVVISFLLWLLRRFF